jgi:acetoin utilization deacetylase AcuC-like enzyme
MALGASRGDDAESAWLFDDNAVQQHMPPGYHPERPERLVAARSGAHTSGVTWQTTTGALATREQLERVHAAHYLDELDKFAANSTHNQADSFRPAARFLDPDTYLGPSSVQSAHIAAGGALQLVHAICTESRVALNGPALRKGFALVRPPGHHARPAQAMGFCLVNNVAVAAAHARALGMPRVAIVDFDVHHGNGTQEIFEHDPHVLYISTHQFPCFPGTGWVGEVGTGDGRGYTVNVPLDPGSTSATYEEAFERLVIPVLDAFAPSIVLVSAGFDANARDPLSEMRVDPQTYYPLTASIRAVAERHAEGRMMMVLEGGYDLPSLERSVRYACRAMCALPADEAAIVPPRLVTAAGPQVLAPALRAAIAQASLHWPSLK